MANIIIGLKSKNHTQKRSNSAIESKEKELLASRKPYKLSKWGKDMVSQIRRDSSSDGKYSPSTCFLDSLKNKGYSGKVPDHAKSDLRKEGYNV